MTALTIACVRTGTKYSAEYVHRLRQMVARHLDRPHRFVCLTDRPGDLADIETVDVAAYGFEGWWAKMVLFETGWRDGQKVLYFDLDTVICGDLSPLADLDVPFGICANFTQAAGHRTWPCRYGSCVMTFAPGWGDHVWLRFIYEAHEFMAEAGRYGDQRVIEKLAPDACLLQERLPAGFFVGYRGLPAHRDRKPDGCTVIVFAGKHSPDNCSVGWVGEHWK